MMTRKGVKFEEKSDFLRILVIPGALFTICPPPPNRFGKVTTMRIAVAK